MRRIAIIVGLVVLAVTGVAAFQQAAQRQSFEYAGPALRVDLDQPDALIRTASLTRLPRDMLKAPIARDVLTQDLVLYYAQHEDRLGLEGAFKRIAYEQKLDWSERMLAHVFDEPAELALWRDGKGALRHFALVIRRNVLAKVLQQLAQVALADRQLAYAGEIDTRSGKAQAYALVLNPRRTLLLIAQDERLVVLSDPGLLFAQGGQMLPAARMSIVAWLEKDEALSAQFNLDASAHNRPMHTLAIGIPSLALGYAQFIAAYRGLRFDFAAQHWRTSVWLDRPQDSPVDLARPGDSALWQAAPVNPGACLLVPVKWAAVHAVLRSAAQQAGAADPNAFDRFGGSALACWYRESRLYAPVFIVHMHDSMDVPGQNAAVQTMAGWALKAGPMQEKTVGKTRAILWRAIVQTDERARSDPATHSVSAAAEATVADETAPTLAIQGRYMIFSPDGELVGRVLDTLSRRLPSVSDQQPASARTLALLTPSRLAGMVQEEALNALDESANDDLRAVLEARLSPRLRALAHYPPYRLELPAQSSATLLGWQRVEWRNAKDKP